MRVGERKTKRMKKLLSSLLVGVTLLAGVGIFSEAAYAEEAESRSALEVTPSGAKVTLSPGEVLEGTNSNCPVGGDGCSVSVKNIGTDAVRFRVYMSPYVVRGEKNELSFAEEEGTSYTQLSKWIAVQNQDGEFVSEAVFSAEPGETVKIPYRINVPGEIPGGSQYAVIWAQIMNDGTGGGIETVGQVGAVLSGRSTVDVVETATISDYDFKKFAFGGPLTATATVENTGNVDYLVNYYYTAKTLFGKELYTNRGKDDTIAAYPGTTYHINLEWGDTPFLGIFQVEWQIVAADQTKTESAVVVIMPIIVMIVLILLLTVIIVWIIIISRKRKERKARKLV